MNLSAVRPVAFFTWNAQSFSERWARRWALGFSTLLRPLLYAMHRVFATRVLHTLLRGISQDRLDLLGEEYFQYVMKPRLKRRSVERLQQWMAENGPVVLVSQGMDHVIRPLANHLGVEYLLTNRLEFRDGLATGRLLDPVVRPRGALARLVGRSPDGRIARGRLLTELGARKQPELLEESIRPALRPVARAIHALVEFNNGKPRARLSVHQSLVHRHILLIGVTGFIAKVWLIHLLKKLPEIGKIYLLIRSQGRNTALRRFEKIVEESASFDVLHEMYGDGLAGFLREKIEVVEGDVSQPSLGIHPDLQERLHRDLDLIVNSAGLTDFNPDLRDALATNVDSLAHLVDFQRKCGHAALMHLSTCYVVGARDGRVPEQVTPDYTPAHVPDFNAEQEWQSLHELVRHTEARSNSGAVTEELRRHIQERSPDGKTLSGAVLENQIRKQRIRWLRNHLIKSGTRRAREFGWPNTYTFTKSLGESILTRRGVDLPIAIVRPSIVESSLEEPFRGWNEGINTSAPLSYLLGTYFRQLPSNERKCLDVIPVDLVCRGMTLIAGALIERRHERMYQLATSASNPCDMRRSIELTCLAHRKYYRSQEGLKPWLRSRFETIPVSKERYQNFSAPRQRALIKAIQKSTPPLPFLKAPFARRERSLDRVEKIIELYKPFILDNDHVFEAENVERLSLALPPEEQRDFQYDPRSIDWWEYWINIHIPAQRKWSYPLIEGRPLEARPPRSFHLYDLSEPAPTEHPSKGSPEPIQKPVATWPSS
ncbi:MAG: SDR family oxidoreductase [Acidobacteria bacterium]|nr:SDR family oxidoreductase [Acidobacteriota bacterium]